MEKQVLKYKKGSQHNAALPLSGARPRAMSTRRKTCLVCVSLPLWCLWPTLGNFNFCVFGGLQQRVALARAMLKSGTIYLLDEPTTGLDGVVSKQIQKTLDALSERVTTVMITHHLDDLKHAHQILYLDGGKIVERGDFEGLMATQGEFYRQVEARKRMA